MRKNTLRSSLILSGLLLTGITMPLTGYALQFPGSPPVPALKNFAPTLNHKTPFQVGEDDPASATLKNGLDALYRKNGLLAITIRDKMPQNSLDRHILTWAIGVSGNPDISSSEIINALAELKGWPGIKAMKINAERALMRENLPPQRIIDEFRAVKPLTNEGVVALAEAFIATGQKDKAHSLIVPWWRTVKLNGKDERLILKRIGAVLTKADQYERMRMMLYASRFSSAEIVAPSDAARTLYEAAVAVNRNEKNAEQKIAAVDKSLQNDALYLFIQIQRLRRLNKIDDATKLMLQAPQNAAALGDPDAWWTERRILSRDLLDKDEPQLAYQLVATHSIESPTQAADAEFHAGWYALRFLDDPQKAIEHFERIPTISSRPVSVSRGYYWMGRAAAAMQKTETATKYFRNAAHFGTTYYGQLAASQLGTKMQVSLLKPSDKAQQLFNAREPVIAIQRLEASGYQERARLLYREFSDSLTNPDELALLSAMAERKNDHYTSLMIGKRAALRGIDVGALTHPIGAIPGSANISAVEKALAYAIARQESEFRVDAVSHAGARGILQLMPATAKAVAKDQGIAYTQAKLTTDAGYNATLGAYFLGQQLERFDGSYILTFIGYNAGPRRATEWIARYGDPRGRPIEDVIDWIERIPYPETRNYVMRVMENYETYKMRLTGKTDITTDLMSGRKS